MIDAQSTQQVDGFQARLEKARAAESKGQWDRALAQYEAALGEAAAAGDVESLIDVLRWIGTLHRERGDLELATEVYETSLYIADAHGLRSHVASALNCLAAIEQFDGRPQCAEELYGRARVLAEEAGDQRLVEVVDQNLGALANIRGDVSQALARYREAYESAVAARDQRAAIAALNNMGMAYVDLDELEAAERAFGQALTLAERAQDSFSLGYVQINLAEMHLRRQQYAQARLCCDEGLSVFTRLESKTGMAEAYKFYGAVYRETGKPELAEIHLGLSLKLAEQARNRLLQAEVHHEMALSLELQERHRDAVTALNEAYRLFSMMQARREIGDVENQIAAIESSYRLVLEEWGAGPIEAKDPYTLGHSRRVADYAERLAVAAGVSGHELSWLQIGAFLHDVGKTVVPGDVLVKPGKLTEDEWTLMKQHTVVGDQLVSDLDLPVPVGHLARSHHERWNGSGYPDGLARTDIPFTARILAVADVYDALTTTRSYRQAFTPRAALETMQMEAGTVLDAELVDLFTTSVWPGVAA